MEFPSISAFGWGAATAFIFGILQGIGSAIGNDVWITLTKSTESVAPITWSFPSITITIISILIGIGLLLYDRSRCSKLVSKSECLEGIERKLDPKFDHVWAILFYPTCTSWHKKERTPYKWMPRNKAIMNRNTKKAYPMLEYAQGILCQGKIQWQTDDWENKKAYERWIIDHGYTLMKEPATEADLLEGT